jgi:hypothetical protein
LKQAPDLEGCCTDVGPLQHRLWRKSHTHGGTREESKNSVDSRHKHDKWEAGRVVNR